MFQKHRGSLGRSNVEPSRFVSLLERTSGCLQEAVVQLSNEGTLSVALPRIFRSGGVVVFYKKHERLWVP
jgi:hypothetical protein